MQSFKAINPTVLKKILKVFTIYHYTIASRQCWSNDFGHLNNYLFLKMLEAVYEIWSDSEKSFEIVNG